jgi:[acyl-carrier-protein] S-malonyltransferase
VMLKEAGAKRAMPLPVSAPFHTSLMKPAGEKLAASIDALEFLAPSIPVVHNVHAQLESDPEKIKQLMVQQIYSPVKWTGCMKTMVDAGITKTVECGPGKVLSGLCKRIDRSLSSYSVEDPASLERAVSELA